MQTTLLKAWASRDSYIPGSNLRAWLFTILRNSFFSELRKHRREVEDVDGAYARALSEEPRHDHVLALRELISAISTLPREQRQALVLMGAHGFSQMETADVCACTLGTVKSRVSRGRAKLNQATAREELGHSTRTPQAGRPLRSAGPDRVVAASSQMAAGAGTD